MTKISQRPQKRPNSNCYRKVEAERLACNSVFFGCDNLGYQTSLVVPCREACLDGILACKAEAPIIEFIDCSYFPFTNESKNCVYEPITCSKPVEINHGHIQWPTSNNTYSSVGNQERRMFPALTGMDYFCNEGYIMQGSNFSECLFTGLWSPPPSCVEKEGIEEFIIITCTLFGTMALCLSIIIPIHLLYKKCGRKHHRDKLHDVFVSYHDDKNLMNNQHYPEYDRVWNTVIPYLEQICVPPFNVMTHPRNFVGGNAIMKSIRYFIKGPSRIIYIFHL